MPFSVEDANSVIAAGEWRDAETIVLPELNVAVSSADPDQISRLDSSGDSPIHTVRTEYYFYATGVLPIDAGYLRGYRDGVNAVTNDLLSLLSQSASNLSDTEVQDSPAFTDSDQFTWGLQAIALNKTQRTGRGVRVAILDTGFDQTHPDFNGRHIESASFVTDAPTAQDELGHGTHCLGTLAGPTAPARGRRYGVAPDVEIFVGKVLDKNGKGREGDILHGINWALKNQCRIISMSFGKAVQRGDRPDDQYDEIGRIALSKNCLLIAAAGNDSRRPGGIEPVEMPANSQTFMAVGAIDRRLDLYIKSNGGVNRDGGGVDLVGPGVQVWSSKLKPFVLGFADGTSMATPHVAGVAALMMEADPTASSEQIWTRLTQNANRLPLSSTDVGAGLVQAG